MKRSNFLVVFLLIALLVGCAKRGRPTGGPKDEDAPIMVNAKPAFKTVNFNSDEIKIYFDEYIKLKDLNKQLVISPPFKNRPIISPQGTPSKYIKIKILDTLKENTTYTLNFGQSVIDNTEGNALKNFSYVFSTGSYIDSLQLKGTIKDAFSSKPDTDVSIMLYELNDAYNDSLVYKEKPFYVGSSLDSTTWNINNIKAGKYKLVALKQGNKDYKFKSATDKIGFLVDTISIPTDKEYEISLFKEKQDFKLNRPSEISKNNLLFGYVGNAKNLKIRNLNSDENFESSIVFEKDKDSLNYWYKNITSDSLYLEVSNKNFIDSIVVKRRSKKIDSLQIVSTVKGVLHPNDTLGVVSNIPVKEIDTTKFVLTKKDSTKVKLNLNHKKMSPKILVNFKRDPNTEYKLQILPNAIKDFLGNTNDTINTNFLIKKQADYGNLYLTLNNVKNYPIIVQLLNVEEELIREVYLSENKQVDFNSLEPSKYRIRVIYDANKNQVWDTGNFLKKIQPEQVIYYPKELDVRANWEITETFVLDN